ncbi:uncharacterized protein LOC136095179 [Hydra vulgaris]|uniref:uncharacterized protein LOC136095179 n=1 Tax=Hydra vulgaris TaxID=6087 RepID=UPI0032EA0B32
MQNDGNLVVYDVYNRAFWSSGTNERGSKPHRLVMQTDGNLVIYDDRLDKLEKEHSSNKSRVEILEKDSSNIKYYIENRSRCNNIRVDGVAELPSETWDDFARAVKKISKNEFGIADDIVVERAH